MRRFLALGLAIPLLAHAQGPSAPDEPASDMPVACASAAQYAAQVWDEIEEQAIELGCWLPTRTGVRTVACSASHFATDLVSGMVGWYNGMVNNSWATIGPRQLQPTWEEGTLRGPTSRTFIGVAPAFSGTTVEIDKESGRPQADATVCAYDQDGGAEILATRHWDSGADSDLATQSIDVSDAGGRVIAVVVSTTTLNPTRSFEYRIRYTTEPIRWDYPAQGFADLHVHQAAELAHGGGWYWGSHAVNSGQAEICDHTSGLAAAANFLIPFGVNPDQHAIPVNMDMGGEVVDHGSDPRRFNQWPDHREIAHQQVHRNWLRDAREGGLRLVVVSAVHNQPMCRGMRALHPHLANQQCEDEHSLKAQLEALIAFDEANDWYEIAVHPWHARKIIHEGKLAVVLSLESSKLMPQTSGSIERQLGDLYALGVRTLQPVHEVDHRFAGAAPHMGLFEVLQGFRYPNQAVSNLFDRDLVGAFDYEPGCNPNDPDQRQDCKNSLGLTPEGNSLVDMMVERNMLVDIAHMSEKGVRDLHARMVGRHDRYPFYDSHTRFQVLLDDATLDTQREFLTTEEQIGFLQDVGGMVGLRTGNNHILDAPSRERQSGPAVANTCPGSSRSFAQMVDYADQRGLQVAYGSDLNGNIHQLGPRYGISRCAASQSAGIRPSRTEPSNGPVNLSGFDGRGLAHIGLLPQLHSDLGELNTPGMQRMNNSAEAFIRMWERTYDRSVRINEECKGGCPAGTACQALGSGARVCVPGRLQLQQQGPLRPASRVGRN